MHRLTARTAVLLLGLQAASVAFIAFWFLPGRLQGFGRGDRSAAEVEAEILRVVAAGAVVVAASAWACWTLRRSQRRERRALGATAVCLALEAGVLALGFHAHEPWPLGLAAVTLLCIALSVPPTRTGRQG
ncbi:hypothetical protein ACF08N_06970 [Streptomyces sp. NPDC015127]|uniref:hypothetical protein n=1 Tax=Streptomyces sp. NPDC015127 TaxID=3364939 RepID=UPI0036F90FC1